MSTSGITYELALALKNARFPQKDDELKCPHGTWIGVSGQMGCCGEKNYLKGKELGVYYPALSGLIEACGKHICLLQGKDSWTAYHSKDGFQEPVGMTAIDVFMEISETGSTPEEAVANLWLKLNGK